MNRLLIFLLLLATTKVFGQAYIFKNYNRVEGMPQSQVWGITQDRYGNMWFATQGGGIVHFDGLHFCEIRKGLKSRYVQNIFADSKNNIWFTYGDGIGRFDGDSIINYDIEYDPKLMYRVRSIFEDTDGNILVASSKGGLLKFDGEKFKRLTKEEGFFDEKVVSVRKQGDSIVMVSLESKIYSLKNGVVSEYDLPDQLEEMWVYDFLEYQGVTYYASYRGVYLENEQGEIKKLSPFASWEIIQLNGVVWIGGVEGVLRVDGDQMENVNQRNGLTDERILDMYVDREDNLWIGTNGQGVFSYSGAMFQYLTSDHGMEGDVTMSITEDSGGNLYFGTMTGLNFFDNKIGDIDSSYPSVGDVRATAKDPEGFVWASGNLGIFRLMDGEVVSKIEWNEDHHLPRIRTMTFKSNGNLVLGTSRGVIEINRSGKIVWEQELAENSKRAELVSFLHRINDDSVIVCSENGVKIYANGSVKPFPNEFLAQESVLSVAKTSRFFWFGSSNKGLVRYDPKNNTTVIYDERDDLSSNLVYFLLADSNENLWVGTVDGLDKVTVGNDDSVQIEYYGSEKGYFGIESNHHAAYESMDGSLWFGTIAGAFKYNPNEDVINEAEPITSIRGVSINYGKNDIRKEAESIEPWYNLPNNLSLPHTKNHLTFYFLGSSMVHPEKVRYKFRLEGFDDDWIDGGAKKSATYANLPHGNYKFKVHAANSHGVWSEIPAVYEFEILPPFWLTSWFIGGMIGLALLLIFGINRLLIHRAVVQNRYVEELKKEEIERTRKSLAMDFHDELGNELANILTYSNLLKYKLQETDEKIRRAIDNLSESASHLLKGTREFIWSIDPSNDNLFEVITYLKDFGEQLFADCEQNFVVRNEILNFKLDQKLPAGWSRQVVLIFKEAMTNSLKHSGACEVTFNVYMKGDKIHITLFDNGCGLLNKFRSFDSNGLDNMKRRSDRINSRLNIDAVNGKGTLIDLELNIPSKKASIAA